MDVVKTIRNSWRVQAWLVFVLGWTAIFFLELDKPLTFDTLVEYLTDVCVFTVVYVGTCVTYVYSQRFIPKRRLKNGLAVMLATCVYVVLSHLLMGLSENWSNAKDFVLEGGLIGFITGVFVMAVEFVTSQLN
jgi:hypothetical protein